MNGMYGDECIEIGAAKNNIPTYKLVYLNKEARDSFETDLASVYMKKAVGEISNFTNLLQNAAYEGKDPKADFEKIVR